MKFEMVHLRRIRSINDEVGKYVSWIQKTVGSPFRVEFRIFDSEAEMLTIVCEILRSQPRATDRDVKPVLLQIQSSRGCAWTGKDQLDLTVAQAASLGWAD